MQRKTTRPGARATLSQPKQIQRRLIQPKLAGKISVESRPAPPVYRPQFAAISTPAPATVTQRKTNAGFRNETRPAPPVYRPSSNLAGVQTKAVENFRLETRPAPPVYRPEPLNLLAQAKMHSESLQAQSQYELSPAVWIGQGRQQIRIRAKGSPTPIGSVDVHFKQPGKAFISDLEVAQAHRKHGLGSMLMKAALDSARRHGSTATMLEANPGPGSISKQALVSMYQKLGFKNAGMSNRGNPMMTIQGKVAPLPNPMAVVQPKMIAPIFSPSVVQRAQALPDELEKLETQKKEAKFGILTAMVTWGPGVNEGEVHVYDTGQGSLDPRYMMQALDWLHARLKENQKPSGTRGTVNFHPSGAVVTLKLMELLGQTLGKGALAKNAKKFRTERKKEDEKLKRTYDKQAQNMAPEMHFEYLENLESLVGVQNVKMTTGLPATDPQDKEDDLPLSNEEIEKLDKIFNQNMLDTSDDAKQRRHAYIRKIMEPEDEKTLDPSLMVELDVDVLPTLSRAIWWSLPWFGQK